MAIRMVTAKEHVYGGKRYKVGEAFDARGRQDAKLLMALGRAEENTPPAAEPAATAPAPATTPAHAPAPARQTAPVYQTASVVADGTDAQAAAFAAEAPADQAKLKRTYKRRDMTAEGGGD